MAKLEPCPNCRKMISTDAAACPKCGQPLDVAMWDTSRAKRVKQGKWVIGIIGVIVIWVTVSNLLNPSPPERPPTNLFKMNAVFLGNPSEQSIKGHMDRIAQRLNVPSTDALYGKWGSVLVALRQATDGVTEMEILRCVEASGTAADFPDLAAICATSLDLQ